MENHGAIGIALILIAGITLILYFLPTIIAVHRKKKNLAPILLVNILLGWTVIGWIVSLVWAVSTETVDTIVLPSKGQVQSAHYQVQGKMCSNCGKFSQADSKFCAHCGNAF
jgi:hypothetical protein